MMSAHWGLTDVIRTATTPLGVTRVAATLDTLLTVMDTHVVVGSSSKGQLATHTFYNHSTGKPLYSTSILQRTMSVN